MIPSKVLVLDTSAIIGQPDCTIALTAPGKTGGPNLVIIPKISLEELDRKSSDERIGHKVREAHHILDALIDAHLLNRSSDLNQGVDNLAIYPDTGGAIALSDATVPIPPYTPTHDTYILGVAKKWLETFKTNLELVTLDTNLKIRAHDEGIPCNRLRRRSVQHVTEENHYKGYANLLVPEEVYIQAGRDGCIALDTLRERSAYSKENAARVFAERQVRTEPVPKMFYNNMGITLINPEMPKYALLLTTDRINRVAKVITYYVDRLRIEGTDIWYHKPPGFFGLQPARNDFAQMHALNMMFDPEIEGVALTGGPGTGKTSLVVTVALSYYLNRVSTTMSKALSAAHQHHQSRHQPNTGVAYGEGHESDADESMIPESFELAYPTGLKFLRPEYVSSVQKIGFLPGGVEEKTEPFVRPIYDALAALQREIGRDPLEAMLEVIKSKEENKNVREVKDIVEIINTALLRGRNFRNCFIICTEYQNGDPDFAELVVGRMHQESKFFMEGDIGQIDNRYGSLSDNAMTLTAYALRETDAPFGFILLDHNYRGGLSKYAKTIREFREGRNGDNV